MTFSIYICIIIVIVWHIMANVVVIIMMVATSLMIQMISVVMLIMMMIMMLMMVIISIVIIIDSGVRFVRVIGVVWMVRKIGRCFCGIGVLSVVRLKIQISSFLSFILVIFLLVVVSITFVKDGWEFNVRNKLLKFLYDNGLWMMPIVEIPDLNDVVFLAPTDANTDHIVRVGHPVAQLFTDRCQQHFTPYFRLLYEIIFKFTIRIFNLFSYIHLLNRLFCILTSTNRLVSSLCPPIKAADCFSSSGSYIVLATLKHPVYYWTRTKISFFYVKSWLLIRINIFLLGNIFLTCTVLNV